jgi:hypothetical protein
MSETGGDVNLKAQDALRLEKKPAGDRVTFRFGVVHCLALTAFRTLLESARRGNDARKRRTFTAESAEGRREKSLSGPLLCVPLRSRAVARANAGPRR